MVGTHIFEKVCVGYLKKKVFKTYFKRLKVNPLNSSLKQWIIEECLTVLASKEHEHSILICTADCNL